MRKQVALLVLVLLGGCAGMDVCVDIFQRECLTDPALVRSTVLQQASAVLINRHAGTYERALAEMMGETVKSCDTIFMVNHGILAVGATLKQAYYRCLVVEDAAKSLVAATVVGAPTFLTQGQIDELMALEGPKHRIRMMQEGT